MNELAVILLNNASVLDASFTVTVLFVTFIITYVCCLNRKLRFTASGHDNNNRHNEKDTCRDESEYVRNQRAKTGVFQSRRDEL